VSSLLVALVAVPLVGSGVLLLLPPPRRDRLATMTGVVVTAVLVPLSVLAAFAPDIDALWIPALGIHFHLGVDGVSAPLLVMTAVLSLLCAIHLLREMPEPGRPGALVGLLLLLEAGMLGTFLALDLLLFFVFFETVLVPMYFVIAVWGGGGRGPAAVKFILYTLLGSAVMLLGLLLVTVRAGTSDISALAAAHGAGLSHGVQVTAFIAIALGLGVKAPLWPLHTWLPDAHTAAPTVGSVLLAGVLLKMGTYGLLRIAVPVLPAGARTMAPYLAALAVVGIVYGSLACLAQRDLKRLIAYSSVGHMGFVLLGIATLTPAGLNGALFASVAHGIITGLLFFLVGAVKDRHGTADLDRLDGGLYERAPRLGGTLAFAAVAGLGLPGLAGFWGEMLAMLGAFRPQAALDRRLYLTLMALAGAGTVLTAAYLLRMIRRTCQGVTSTWREVLVPDLRVHEWVVFGPLVAGTLVLGLWPQALLGVTVPAVRVLLAGAGAP
jgi:NADH-quinone oxidoreductase subunit M